MIFDLCLKILNAHIKKIPGKRACFVTYTNQHTIYIDPDKESINNLEQKYIEY